MAAVSMGVAQAVDAAGRVERVDRSTGAARAFSEVLAEWRIGTPPAPPSGQGFAPGQVLGQMEAGRRRLDQIIEQAKAGKTFRPGELLAMQAEVHRISEEMALTHRLVEEGMSGFRKLWSMQV